MKRIAMLGVAFTCAAGTASAQTSVRLSLGFGVPRPHLSGSVFVGRPHVRPVYRPFFHVGYDHRPCLRGPVLVAVPPVYRSPWRVIVIESRRVHRLHRRGHAGERWDDDRH